MRVIKECLRVSRYVFWNVQWVRSTREMIFAIQNIYRDNLKDIFIWQKQAVANITAKDGGMAKGWEYVFMLGHDNLTTFNYNNFPKNGYVPNIKTWYKKETFKEHHATFTREMAFYFIENFTKEGDTVLDPFSGTGTTLFAAKELKRKSIGIDIDPKYFEIAKRRIDQAMENLL